MGSEEDQGVKEWTRGRGARPEVVLDWRLEPRFDLRWGVDLGRGRVQRDSRRRDVGIEEMGCRAARLLFPPSVQLSYLGSSSRSTSSHRCSARRSFVSSFQLPPEHQATSPQRSQVHPIPATRRKDTKLTRCAKSNSPNHPSLVVNFFAEV